MGTEVVLHRSDVPAKFTEQMHMAQVLAESDLLPKHLRGRPANVLVILQGARALDVAGFWALQSMHVVDGRLGMAAELMRALVIRAGHRFTVIERTMDRAIVEIKRADRDKPYRAEFTWQDAKDAELTAKDNWRKYRKSMLVARATSIAVRDECADVMFGVVYTPDELGAVTDEEGTPVTVDGEAVEAWTDEEISDVADAIVNTPLDELPVVWLGVLDHAAALAAVPEANGQTLTDWLAARLGVEASVCGTRAEVRRLWDLGQAMKVMRLKIGDGGQAMEFGALLKSLGASLPEEAPEQPEQQSEVIVDGEMVGADTEHAQQMKAAASASWSERDLAAREQVFDQLHEARTGEKP